MPRRRVERHQVDNPARLEARPAAGGTPGAAASRPSGGLQPLELARGRDGLLYVPAGYAPDRPPPLVVLLHGAGGDARDILSVLRPHADAQGLLLLAPDSRQGTWDVIRGGYGPDVAFLDAALAATFARYAVDTHRVAVSGFSDGASYALSLGVLNGDLATHLIGFSPGFLAPPAVAGRPRVFISHGRGDRVLPIDRCGRRLARVLSATGYPVEYLEFGGGHEVPADVAVTALQWLGDRPG